MISDILFGKKQNVIFHFCSTFILVIVLLGILLILNESYVVSSKSNSKLRDRDRCTYVYLPNIGKDPIHYLVSFKEEEDNDGSNQANGIWLNTEYTGYPDDRYDTYTFILPVPTIITVEVKNHDAITGQVTLYDANQVLHGYSQDPPTHQVIVNGVSGRYYIFVSTLTETNTYTPTAPYNLKVLTELEITPEPISDTYTAVFDGDKIDANHSLKQARTNTVTLRIPLGNYKITLHSSDDHNNGQIQEQERWYLEFLDQAGDLITQTNPTEDLPDNRNCQFDVVHDTDNGLTITEEVYAVRGMHLVHPNEKPESVRPERAIIEQILP